MMGIRLLTALLALLTTVPAAAAMRLGVNTHFDQGWPLPLFQNVAEAHAGAIRDTVSWGKIEHSPGIYDFATPASRYAAIACQRRMPMVLMITPQNRLYDSGKTIQSPEARRAFGAYLKALATRFPCISAFEIGNEINGAGGLTGPAKAAMPGAYIAILRDVHDALKPTHPGIAILGGSTNVIGIGFLETLFAAGMLPLVDGVAVHPYSNAPEQLAIEIARLRAAMQRHGPVKPIWATEFGLWYKSPAAAPPHALRVITVLSAAGVTEADWYALMDEHYYPNMGLYAGVATKPALATFRFAAQQLLSAGDAHRIDTGDPLTFIYRYGNGAYVMWAADRAIRFAGKVITRDAGGRVIAPPASLGLEPIIVDGGAAYILGPRRVIADTGFDYGMAPWSHIMIGTQGGERPMDWIDWRWTSYIGNPGNSEPQVNAGGVILGGGGVIERFTAATAGPIGIGGCFQARGSKGPVQLDVTDNGRSIFSGAVGVETRLPALRLNVARGEQIDFRFGGAYGATVARRVRIAAGGVPAAPCSVASAGNP